MLQPDQRNREKSSFIERNLNLGLYTLTLLALVAAYRSPGVSEVVRNGFAPQGRPTATATAENTTFGQKPDFVIGATNLPAQPPQEVRHDENLVTLVPNDQPEETLGPVDTRLNNLQVGDVVEVLLHGKFNKSGKDTGSVKISDLMVDDAGNVVGILAAPLNEDGSTIDMLLDAYVGQEIYQ